MLEPAGLGLADQPFQSLALNPHPRRGHLAGVEGWGQAAASETTPAPGFAHRETEAAPAALQPQQQHQPGAARPRRARKTWV